MALQSDQQSWHSSVVFMLLLWFWLFLILFDVCCIPTVVLCCYSNLSDHNMQLGNIKKKCSGNVRILVKLKVTLASETYSCMVFIVFLICLSL